MDDLPPGGCLTRIHAGRDGFNWTGSGFSSLVRFVESSNWLRASPSLPLTGLRAFCFLGVEVSSSFSSSDSSNFLPSDLIFDAGDKLFLKWQPMFSFPGARGGVLKLGSPELALLSDRLRRNFLPDLIRGLGISSVSWHLFWNLSSERGRFCYNRITKLVTRANRFFLNDGLENLSL